MDCQVYKWYCSLLEMIQISQNLSNLMTPKSEPLHPLHGVRISCDQEVERGRGGH